MDSFWGQLREQLQGTWLKLNAVQKGLVITAVVTILLTMVVLGRMATKPDMVPLFTNLNSHDAGAIITKLDELKVPYDLADGGSTLLVPNRERDRLRIQLAMDDLPRRGVVGFESWSETRFGETDTDKRVRMLVALQGELTRTIESLEEVEAARVHIVMPEQALFSRDAKSATASIVLKLRPFAQLNDNQVLAIMRLVANSVQDLQAEEVVVIDNFGNILSENVAEKTSPTLARLTATQLEIKEHFERNLARSVESMLEKPFGYGKVVVRVSADLNFDEMERRSQTWGDNVVRSESSLEETSSGTGTNPEGVVDPGGAPVELTQSTSEYERNERIRNYEVDLVEEYIRSSPGSIRHLSVSVVVDTGDDATLDPQTREMIANAVVSAAGIRAERNDSVEVIGLPFNTKAFDDLQRQLEEYQRQRLIRQIITYGVSALIIIIALVLGIRYVRNRKPAIKQQPKMEEVVQQQVELTAEEKERELMKKQLETLAKEKPSEVAQLLKTWIAEDMR